MRISIKSKNEAEARECVKALCDLEEGLTDWEVNFIDTAASREAPFTEKQLKVIFDIYDKHC